MDGITITILVTGAAAMIVVFILLWRLYSRLCELTQRFNEHGHNTSIRGGTTQKPIGQQEVSFEQLIAAIQSVQKNNMVDVKTMKGLIDATNESESRS